MTFSEKCLECAQEGIVLLRNEGKMLPLVSADRVGVFGRAQKDWYRSGTGSGGSVHCDYSTNLVDSLLELENEGGSAAVDRNLLALYESWLVDNPFDNGGNLWAAEPYCQKEMDISKSLADSVACRSNKALFVIGRNTGEDKDYRDEDGSYRLTAQERSNLKAVCEAFESVCVVFNTSGIVDAGWLDDVDFKGHIKAVVYAWEGGQEGGRAVARVLAGKAYPSGKLSCSVARALADYPSSPWFAGKDGSVYREDIFVGYRYFMTFARDRILFPFGFGLSYADFALESPRAHFEPASDMADSKIVICARVRNRGKLYKGKEVLQVYYESPQGKLGKSVRSLSAFAKTEELAPGQSQDLELSFFIRDMASYDESGLTGNESCFVLEKGLYTFYVGTDSLSAAPVLLDGREGLALECDVVVERLEQALAPAEAFPVLRP
ncbi:MAG: glycoside hydrolase family 3 C-terminal domain-containing protein, partial [Treponema sp.]|nr:glycoside hydrolase family 3 C-terminal domain-containing protein [Treponema sp.]